MEVKREDREFYDVITIYLNANHTDLPVPIDANIVIVGQVPISVQARINDVGNKQFDLQIFRRINMEVKRLYITTTTTNSTPLILFVSKGITVETSGFGERATLIDTLGVVYDARDIVNEAADSTTATINDTATYTGSQFTTDGFNKIVGILFANRDLTLYVDQSSDGTNYDDITSISYTASSTDGGFSVEIVAPYARIRVNNASGGNATTVRMYARLSTGA